MLGSYGEWVKIQAAAELLRTKAERLNAELGFLSPELGELLIVARILSEIVNESADKAA